MSKNDTDQEQTSDNVTWTSQKIVERGGDRRSGQDRRQTSGRTMTVPDMRLNGERRKRGERRKVRLTITGRAINI